MILEREKPVVDALRPWPSRSADRDALKDARLQTLGAAQWLARMAQSFLPATSNNSHLLLDWADGRRAIVSPEFAPNTVVELRLPEFFMHFRESGRPTLHPIVLDGKSPAEVEAWCLIELLHRNLDRDRFSKDLPYDVSAFLSGDARQFETFKRKAAFDELAGWLNAAASVLLAVPGTACRGPRDVRSRLKVAPDDLSMSLAPAPGGQRGTRPVEIGFRVGDDGAEAPYFYAATLGDDGRPAFTSGTSGAGAKPVLVLSADTILRDDLTRDDVAARLADLAGADG